MVPSRVKLEEGSRGAGSGRSGVVTLLEAVDTSLWSWSRQPSLPFMSSSSCDGGRTRKLETEVSASASGSVSASTSASRRARRMGRKGEGEAGGRAAR